MKGKVGVLLQGGTEGSSAWYLLVTDAMFCRSSFSLLCPLLTPIRWKAISTPLDNDRANAQQAILA
jgi:hypothetical protein